MSDLESSRESEKSPGSDLNLWNKIRTGDAAAFSLLFKKYYLPLYQFSYRFVPDTQTAENKVQEVFVALWMQREKLQIHSNLKSYLFSAVRNRTINHLKQVKNRFAEEPGELAGNDTIMTPEDNYLKNEIDSLVHQAIQKLPEKCRQIYLMKRYDDLKYTEIADELVSLELKLNKL